MTKEVRLGFRQGFGLPRNTSSLPPLGFRQGFFPVEFTATPDLNASTHRGSCSEDLFVNVDNDSNLSDNSDSSDETATAVPNP